MLGGRLGVRKRGPWARVPESGRRRGRMAPALAGVVWPRRARSVAPAAPRRPCPFSANSPAPPRTPPPAARRAHLPPQRAQRLHKRERRVLQAPLPKPLLLPRRRRREPPLGAQRGALLCGLGVQPARRELGQQHAAHAGRVAAGGLRFGLVRFGMVWSVRLVGGWGRRRAVACACGPRCAFAHPTPRGGAAAHLNGGHDLARPLHVGPLPAHEAVHEGAPRL